MTTNQDFQGTCALVTGATSGIGLATARALLSRGAKVIATGRRGDRLAALAKECGDGLHTLAFDMRDAKALERAIASLPAPFAKVDLLVNNAGLALGLEPAHRASLDQWQQMLDTNCTALVTLTRALLPGMVERARGHIINVGSVAGSCAYPGGNVYGATKAFVSQFTRNLRADLAGTGVRATCIEPGAVETEFSLVRFEQDAARASKVYEGFSPLTAEDIAESILWCASRPPHVNIMTLELLPEAQGFGPFNIVKRPAK